MSLFPADFGYDLWVVYVIWALLVICMYPVCRWFGGVKADCKNSDICVDSSL